MRLLQLRQQVQHLRADGDVERRDRLVEHEDFRPQHQRAGDGDALALAAGEHVRVAVVELRPQPDLAPSWRAPRRAAPRPPRSVLTSSGSSSARPIFWRGLSDP